ncbi:ankyrin [Xylaria sp. FL0064]|nr:ankyrin [Xylaria sp. FL0064]
MDTLSGVASALAVVSLALQLAESASEIKRFLDTIQNAPTEITRIKGLVTQIHLVAQTIEALLKDQRIIRNRDDQVSHNIHDSLRICREKLDLVRDVLRVADNLNKKKNTVSRNWTQIRLAFKKEKIEEFERQLEQAIALLNTNLLVNLMRSDLLIESNFRSMAQSPSSNLLILPPGSLVYRSQSLEPILGLGPTIFNPTNLSKPSCRKTWWKGSIFDVQYYRLYGRNQRQSLLFRVNIYGSYLFTVQLSTIFSAAPSIPFNLSIRNLISDDAAILYACRIGDSEHARQLLKTRIARPNDVTLDNRTPLGVAINGGYEEIVQLLLQEGADPNAPCGTLGMSPLQYGIALDRRNIVRILVQRGADPAYTSAGGWSLYHYMFERDRSAANKQYFSMFHDCLIFDDVQDSQGWTSLHRCAAFGTAEDIYCLHRVGAPAWSGRYITLWGGTPIHVAALKNNVSTLEALFDLCNGQLDALDAADNFGWTPLHRAVYHGAKDAMRWLLSMGADPHRTTYRIGRFPKGHEGEVFNAADLASLSGIECQQVFIGILKDLGHDITIDGSDIYWESG